MQLFMLNQWYWCRICSNRNINWIPETKESQWFAGFWNSERMCFNSSCNCHKIQERSLLKYHFARKLVSLDQRQNVEKPEDVVIAKLSDDKWRTATQADDNTGHRKFLSEAKQFYREKFAGFRFGKDRLNSFLFAVLNAEKAHEDLWNTLKVLTMSHGKAATKYWFLVNKEILAPNLKESNMTAIHVIHDSMLAKQSKVKICLLQETMQIRSTRFIY